MTNDDYFLLQKLREGDIEAIECLYIRYAPQVKSFVSAILKDPADADDFVQDLFLRLYEERAVVCKAKSFRSYLYSMTRNMLYNKLKHRKVHERFVNFERKRKAHHDIETQILTKDILNHISEEMDKLTERQKIIYEMNRDGDLTYNEIAAKLGISPKTVQYHIGKVLARLKKIMAG